MDESGGSGQPRSGNDQSAEEHAGSAAPALDPARPEPPAPDATGARPPAADRATPNRSFEKPPASTEPWTDDPVTPEHGTEPPE
ncbi:peptidase, partial [Streptomyces sp. DH24]|nr:peptidase [Streptomyces sp. DH24]